MASSNVQYYEKQKELQDTIADCEQQRFVLEKQFRLALQQDQTSSKLKASKLQSYWKKICDDEKRAKQRNEQLLREFAKIDAHMAEMNARTQRLALMKKQYEDYIARTYPEWNELMYGPSQQQASHRIPVHEQNTQSQRSLGPESEQSTAHAVRNNSQKNYEMPQDSSDVKHSSSAVSQQEMWQRQKNLAEEQNREHEEWQQLPQGQQMQQLEQQRQQLQLHEQQQQNRQDIWHQNSHEEERRNSQTTSGMQYIEETSFGVYQNLPSARDKIVDSNLEEHRNAGMSKPQQHLPRESVDVQSGNSGVMMQPGNYISDVKGEDDFVDEETSEFGTDTELPMAQSLGNTAVPVNRQNSETDVKHKSKDVGSLKPELTIDGLIRLLRLIEKDMSDAFSLEGYYRSSWPNTAQKNDIIRKSNQDEDLSRVDANLISMVVLEQITLIVVMLPEKCVLPEDLMQDDVTESQLRQHQSPEAQVIWGALFSHFQQLVKNQAMEPHELSAIFTPSLVADRSSQDRAHMFMVKLLESHRGNINDNSGVLKGNYSLTPPQTLEGSGSFMEDGRVPPLKFGSLLDKPLSDDDSSYVKSSLPRDPMPLNETEAYKSMISSGRKIQAKRSSSAQEDTDDDVEKQIASALITKPVVEPSPRARSEQDEPSELSSQTLQSGSHVYVPTAMDIRPVVTQPGSGRKQTKFQGVKISSDLDTDTEVDAGIFGSSKKAEDNFDFDFYD